jgi:TetR/AcrR family transcriptional regulator, cholesterol catabolism regulator
LSSSDPPQHARAGRQETNTRAKIVHHAVKHFARDGYGNTSLDDIAASVGIKKASLYHYIRTKEDLLYEIQAVLAQDLLDEVGALLELASTPEEKVTAFFRAAFRLVARRQAELTIFLNETQTLRAKSKRWREINAKRGEYQKLFEDVLIEGTADGAFRQLPTTLTALAMLGAVTWAYRWYSPGGLDPDQIADLYVDIFLNGITERP